MTQINYDRPKISYTPPAVQGPKKIPTYKPKKYIKEVSLQPYEPMDRKILKTSADITARTGVAAFCIGVGGGIIWVANKFIKFKRR